MGVKNFVDYDNADAIIRKIDQKIDSNGAHEILNAAGTALTQRSQMQFKGGLSASDDSTNGKTVVSGDYPVFTWDAWIAMTEQEQEAYPDAIITDAPGIDGVLTLDMMTKLWENPDPTSAMAIGAEINLSDDNYDMLVISVGFNTANPQPICTLLGKKGQNFVLNSSTYEGGSAYVCDRILNYTNDKKYTSGNSRSNGTNNTGILIPLYIYGIKLQHQIDVSAVITPSSSPNHQFAIATTDWEANTGSDATEFPYVANIATTDFSDTFVPARVMLLGADGSDYPTAAEEADIALVDKYIEFSATAVRLRATDTPTNALTLIVAGAVVGTRNMVPVAASDVLMSDNHTVEECLMASNDVPFRFAYDSTSQKYGYIIQNGGADTFVPFKNMADVNPEKQRSNNYLINVQTDAQAHIPIGGYSKVSLCFDSESGSQKYNFYLSDGTTTSDTSYSSTNKQFGNYIDIPSNAITMRIINNGSGRTNMYYSLLA